MNNRTNSSSSELEQSSLSQPEREARPQIRWARKFWLYLLLSVLVIGVLTAWMYVQKQNELRLVHERKLQQMEALQARQLKDAQLALTEAEALLELRDWNQFSLKLRRARALDLNNSLNTEIIHLEALRVETVFNDKKKADIEEALRKSEELLEGKKFDKARAVYDSMLVKYPKSEAINVALKHLGSAKEAHLEEIRLRKIQEHESEVNLLLAKGDWQSATKLLTQLKELGYKRELVLKTVRKIQNVESEEKLKRAKALAVIASAKREDKGAYSQKILDKLDLALVAAPNVTELQKYREEIYARPRIIKVPENVSTLSEAIKSVRSGDGILLAEGTFSTNEVIQHGISIRGQGKGKSIITNHYNEGPSLVFGAGKSSLTNLEIRGSGIALADQGYAGIVLGGGQLSVCEVLISHSVGHGIAVKSGELHMKNSLVIESAWNGVSVHGENSSAIVENVSILRACQHGIEVWSGASAELKNDVSIEECDGTGAVVNGKSSSLKIEGSLIKNNRESGIAASWGGCLDVQRTIVSKNLFSGITGTKQGTKVSLEKVTTLENAQAGIWLGDAVMLSKHVECFSEKNGMQQKRLPVSKLR